MSTFSNTFGAAGFATEKTHTPRSVLASPSGAMYMPAGRVLDGSKARDPLNTGDLDVLRPGLLIGKITSGGKFAPSILGVTTVAYASGATVNTTLTVSAATATEIVRRIGSSGTFKISGPPSAAGTVATATVTFSAVNTSTGVITITALAANYIAGSFIRPADGSETILGILDQHLKVTDPDGTSQDTVLSRLLVGGMIDASQILNWPSDTSLVAWVKTQLRAVGMAYTFDDDFGF